MHHNFTRRILAFAFFIVLGGISLGLAIVAPQLLIAVCVLLALYGGFGGRVWVLTIAAIPALALGESVPITLTETLTYTVSLGELLLYCAFGFLVANRIVGRYSDEVSMRLGLPFGFLAAYVLVGAAFYQSVASLHWFVLQLHIVFTSLVAYVVARATITTPRHVRWFLRALAVAAVLFAAQAIWYVATHGLSSELLYERSRIVLPAGAVAFVSAMIAFILPTIFAAGHSSTNIREKAVFTMASAASFVAILLLMSKAAIGSLFVGMMFFVLRARRNRAKIIATSIAVLSITFIALSPFIESLAGRVISATMDASNQYRLEEYRLIWLATKDHLAFGLGPGQHIVYYQRFVYPDFIQLLNNYFLQAFADLGLAGVAIVMGLFATIARTARRLVKFSTSRIPYGAGMAASLLVAAINGLAEVTFFGLSYAILFWMFVGISEAMVNKEWNMRKT